jgi:riboflavin synthase
MFSGIIKATGIVTSIADTGTTKRVTIASPISNTLFVDQSISHDGVCLTVVEVGETSHQVDIVKETLSKTTFDAIKIGQQINLEKSITPSTLIDGHLVQGHVDTTLRCLARRDENGSWNFTFELPEAFTLLVIPHGSVCLNGVSLTVAQLYDDAFEVAIIPYTYQHTNFNTLQPGDRVNVEFDLIGKYILRQRK